jgi:hypothetical protein
MVGGRKIRTVCGLSSRIAGDVTFVAKSGFADLPSALVLMV